MTQLIVDGRHAAIDRLEQEARDESARGLTGVSSELRQIGNLMEFMALGSAVSGDDQKASFFSTACSGQDLFCQIDSGYEPRHFVMGNVAYAQGIGRRASRPSSARSPGARSTRSGAWSTTRARTAWTTSGSKPRKCGPTG